MEWSFDHIGAYFLETTFCWLVFYGLYLVLFKDLTFFSINRFYLLATFIIGLLVPCITIPVETVQAYPFVGVELPEIRITANQPAAIAPEITSKTSAGYSLTYFLWLVYWLGVAIAAGKFAMELFKIYRLFRQADRLDQNGYTLALTQKAHFPFSFLNVLFWSRDYTPEDQDAAHIEEHELAHIRQFHSLDILILELLGIFFWFNPLIYWYKKSIKNVHEYLADASVLEQTSVRNYGTILLKHAQSGHHFALTHPLIPSQLKQRILMMTKTNSPKSLALKYALAAPVLILFVLAFSFKTSFAEGPERLPSTQEIPALMLDTIPGKVFKVVEEMPRFAGCEDMKQDPQQLKNCAQKKLFEFIFTNLTYPKEAKEAGIEGTTVVQFIVGKDGSVLAPKIIRSIHSSIDKEVLRVTNAMPNWIPGKQGGKTVNVQFNLPVKFKLDDNDKRADADYDEMPLFNGCADAESKEDQVRCTKESLFEYMINELNYPEEAKKKGIEGKVVATFVVDETGKIATIDIKQSLGYGCDKEVSRLIMEMPDWTPAQKDGKAVAAEMSLPVVFQLPKKHTIDTDAPNTLDVQLTLDIQELEAFPNPARDVLNVRFKAPVGGTTVQLVSLQGQVVAQQDFPDFKGQADISFELGQLSSGSYVLAIQQGEKMYSEKVVIK
jgi:bla regulator protein BlaR1